MQSFIAAATVHQTAAGGALAQPKGGLGDRASGVLQHCFQPWARLGAFGTGTSTTVSITAFMARVYRVGPPAVDTATATSTAANAGTSAGTATSRTVAI